MRFRWAVIGALVAVMATVAPACTKGEVEDLPAAPKLPETTTTVVVDLSGIALNAVPGRTTTTIALQPGQATISGTVVGPGGPVPQAIVRAERVVGEASGSIDILTGADGTFAFTTMVGGRYRVRAWKPAPDNLALVTPEVFFLEARESKVLALTTRPYQGLAVASDMAPKPPLLEEPTNLVVQVTDRAVDAQGVVRGTPVADVRVELFGAGDWQLRSENPAITDANGRVVFTLDCQRAGQQPLSVVVGDSATFPLEIPACAVPAEAAETTTTASDTTLPPSTARPGSTTTTSRTTTTTTRGTSTTR